MATPRKNNHLISSNSPTKYEDYIMNLSPLRQTTSSSSSISTHINLLSSSSLSPSLVLHRITSIDDDELRFQTDLFHVSGDDGSGGPAGLSVEVVPRRTARRRCLFSETAAVVNGTKAAGDDVEVGATRSLSRAVSALAGLNWEDKSSMNPTYLNHVMSLWRELIPATYAPSSSSPQEEEEDEPDVPAKKRTKLEHDTETGSCKRCSCRKSRCLKLYCECFGSGNYCTGPCLCQNCLNKPIFKDKVLEARSRIESRNPLAFAPKLIKGIKEESTDTTPASTTKHRQGCKCKRSSCLKKYCECFQAGVGCSFNCRCQGCRNPFGCKADHIEARRSIRRESNILNLQGDDRDEADYMDTLMNTRRHVGVGAADLFKEKYENPRPYQESITFESSYNVPKTEHEQHYDNTESIDLSAPQILKSSSPNGKRVSLPRVMLRNLYHPTLQR